MVLKRLGWALAFACALSYGLQAQQGVLPPILRTATLTGTDCTISDTVLTASGCIAANVTGYASASIQVSGTWSGTLTFKLTNTIGSQQTVSVTPTNSTTTVTSTTANGAWSVSLGGFKYLIVQVTAYTSGSPTVTIGTAFSGGGSGGGGGGAASSVTINDPTITTQKLAINASGQASVTCANCSGSGASAVDNAIFTVNAGSGAPAMGFYNSVIPTVTDGNAALFGMDLNRNQFFVLRDASGRNQGANVNQSGQLSVEVNNKPSVNQNGAPWLFLIRDGSGNARSANVNASNQLSVSVDASALPTGAATATNQTGGLQKTQIVDGSGNVAAVISGNASLSTVLRDGAGNSRSANVNASSQLSVTVDNTPVLGAGASIIGKVDVLGNAGATMDATVGAGTAPTNALITGLVYNSTIPTPTDGQSLAFQADLKGRAATVIQDGAGTNRAADVNQSGQLSVNVGNQPSVTQAGNWAVNIKGNSGASLDSGISAGAAPLNALMTGLVYNSVLPTPTDGQALAVQADLKGRAAMVLQDGAGTNRAADVDASGRLSVSVGNTPAVAFNAGGNQTTPIFCNNYKFDRSTTGDVQLVAVSGTTSIYICGYRATGESTTTSDVSLEYGTGSNCGTGTVGLTPPTTVGTSTSGGMIGGVVIPPGLWSGLKTPAGTALCVHRSASQTSEIEVWWTQF